MELDFEIECPCCEELAAEDYVYGGDPTLCGCSAGVWFDEDGDPEVILNESADDPLVCEFCADEEEEEIG